MKEREQFFCMMLLLSETSEAYLDQQKVDQAADQLRFDKAVDFDHLDREAVLRKLQPGRNDMQRKYTIQTNYVLTLTADIGDSFSLRSEYSHSRYAGMNNLRGLCVCVPRSPI